MLILLVVGAVTGFALVGMTPWFHVVTLREALFLAALNILFMSVYFEFVSPSRDEVPGFVTSSLAVFAGIVGTLTVDAFFNSPILENLHYIAAGALLILILFVWFWYDIIVLRSFHVQVREITENVPLPKFIEKNLVERDDK